MNIILFRGKYVKPIIELMNEKANHIFLIEYLSERRELVFRNTIPSLSTKDYKQIVITKKDYNRLLTLLSIMDNPLEAFESIYYKEYLL